MLKDQNKRYKFLILKYLPFYTGTLILPNFIGSFPAILPIHNVCVCLPYSQV